MSSRPLGLALLLGLALGAAVVPPTNWTKHPSAAHDCDPTEAPEAVIAFKLNLTSPTTIDVEILHSELLEFMGYHPFKCYAADEDPDYQLGQLFLLGQACQVNNPDWFSCFRRTNFEYPVKPSSGMIKIAMFPKSDLSGWDELEGRSTFQASRLPRDEWSPGSFRIEVCAPTAGCTPNQGDCLPSFSFVAPDLRGSKNLWAGTNFETEFDALDTLVQEWDQVSALPEYGPYPPCEEDENGVATLCWDNGDDQFRMTMTDITLEAAEIRNDDSVMFRITYTLSWGDRYAVHPCTIDLFDVRTQGKQYRVKSSRFWTPSFDIISAAADTQTLFAEASLGVSTKFGSPVKESLGEDEAWPKQLVLDRKYRMQYYPTLKINWDTYPFDSQVAELIISENNLPPGLLALDISGANLDHSGVSTGSDFKKVDVQANVVKVRGRQALKISVKVKRDPKGKVWALFLPILCLGFFESAFHLLIQDYGATDGIFMTQAVTVSVGLAMTDPSFLGFPVSAGGVPFAQAFAMMLVLGALKTSFMILGRLFWDRRIKDNQDTMDDIKAKFDAQGIFFGPGRAGGDVAPFVKKAETAAAAGEGGNLKVEVGAQKRPPASGAKVAPEVDENHVPWSFSWEDVDQEAAARDYREYMRLLAEMSYLGDCLKRYDLVIRISVPVWYLITWPITTLVYFA